MTTLLLLIALTFTLLLYWRKVWIRTDIRAGALLVLPFLFTHSLLSSVLHAPQALFSLWVIVLGALSAALYSSIIHRHLHPVVGFELRRPLLFVGVLPILSAVIALTSGLSFLLVVTSALLLGVIFIFVIRRVLIWDALTAMLGMGLLYALLDVVGVSIFHLGTSGGGALIGMFPVADLLSIFLFGALWGPVFSWLRTNKRTFNAHSTHPRHIPRPLFVLVTGLCILVGATWVNAQFMQTPHVSTVTPATGEVLSSLTSPLVLSFDLPVQQNTLKITLNPPLDGDLSFSDPYVQRTFMRQVTFIPTTYAQPDTFYTVTVSGIKNILGYSETGYTFSFHTASLPTVTSTTPDTAAVDVPICDPFTITLSQPVSKLTEISFQLTPSVDFETKLSDDLKTYTLTPKGCLAQSQVYTLSSFRRLMVTNTDSVLIATGDPLEMSKISITTKGSPGVTSVAPQGGGVLSTEKEVVITFTEDMQQMDLAHYFSITPTIAGTWTWRDPKTAVYSFTSALPLDTEISIAMKEGLKDTKGGFLPTAATYHFTTIGHVRLSSASPYPGSAGVSSSASIRLSFDQPVDHSSAEAKFSTDPATTGSFTWNGQTLIYQTTFEKDTSYRLTLASGVVSTIGLPLANAYTSSFRTEESTTLLNIPVYYQRHALSCEVASLKMALNYKSVSVSEDTLLNALPTDSAPRSGNIWSDPDQVFVGDVNGHQNTTGYGVHANPIAALAGSYRTAHVTSGWLITDIAHSIASSNPVVIWGYMGSGKNDSWTTGSGRTINTLIGEHVRLVVGFTGNESNPTSIIINDPIVGRIRWTAAQFKANWATLGNMGVAIQ